jgi:benzodiazapine receptor
MKVAANSIIQPLFTTFLKIAFMSRTQQIVLNWITLILVITVNALANILPINGITTAEVSARYPNLFVPAGFTFGIWGFIYLLHILHVGFSTYILVSPHRTASPIGALTQKINPWFWLSCVLNSCWILAWHHHHVLLSVVIMIALFFTLMVVFRIITISERTLALGYLEHISLETPFIIYLSWINVAMIANITALLVSNGWQGGGIEPYIWSCIMIGVATIIGVWMSVKWHRPAYTAVIVWSIIGIYANQSAANATIGYAAIAAIVICLLSAAAGFWYKRKLLFKKSGQHY